MQRETQIEKTTKVDQNDKTKERRWKMQRQKGKGNARKNNDTTWGNKPESTDKWRKIEKILTKGKTIQTTQDIPKSRKENPTKNGGR